jgi:hypothetical protein
LNGYQYAALRALVGATMKLYREMKRGKVYTRNEVVDHLMNVYQRLGTILPEPETVINFLADQVTST